MWCVEFLFDDKNIWHNFSTITLVECVWQVNEKKIQKKYFAWSVLEKSNWVDDWWQYIETDNNNNKISLLCMYQIRHYSSGIQFYIQTQYKSSKPLSHQTINKTRQILVFMWYLAKRASEAMCSPTYSMWIDYAMYNIQAWYTQRIYADIHSDTQRHANLISDALHAITTHTTQAFIH